MKEMEHCAVRHTSPVEQILISKTSVPYGTEHKTSAIFIYRASVPSGHFLVGMCNITT